MEPDKLQEIYESNFIKKPILEYGRPPTEGEAYSILRARLYNSLKDCVKNYLRSNISFESLLKDLDKIKNTIE